MTKKNENSNLKLTEKEYGRKEGNTIMYEKKIVKAERR
jgi:hypothetical protein